MHSTESTYMLKINTSGCTVMKSFYLYSMRENVKKKKKFKTNNIQQTFIWLIAHLDIKVDSY